MSGLSSTTRPSSTFWIIDTTSVSDSFTTTATFTLWVPLNTPSTTANPTTSSEPTENPAPRSNTPVIAGSVIGSLLGACLVFTCLVLYYKRRRTVRPRTKLPETPSGSEHALVDLIAEPAPHPGNIEPWIAPTVFRRPNKARDEAQVAARAETLPAGASAPSSSAQVQSLRPTQVQETPGSTSHGHDPVPVSRPSPSLPRLHLHQPQVLPTGAKSTAAPRRRTRGPSPPRLEEDAGVSLMRAGDDALPPSYGELVHDRLPG